MKSKKERLGAALKQRFKERHLTFAKAAKDLSISPDSLRGWISRNRFPPNKLVQLTELAGLPTDLPQIREEYEFREQVRPEGPATPVKVTRTLSQALGWLDERAFEMRRFYRDLGEDVQLLFGSMGPGDIYVFCSLDMIPYEVDPGGWTVAGADVTKAVKDGAYFIYVYPSERVISDSRRFQLRRLLSQEEFEEAIEAHKERIFNKMSGEMSRADINVHVCGIPSDSSLFMIPGHKFVLFQPKPGQERCRATAGYPIAGSDSNRSLHLPLAEEVSQQFLNFVIALLGRSNRHDLTRLFT